MPIYETFPNSRAARQRGAARALLALDPRPTALLAMSDELALGVARRRARAGLAVPRTAVGRRLRRRRRPPPPRALTTVRQPLVEKGRAAGRMLLEALDGGTPADVALPTELVVRGSTATP